MFNETTVTTNTPEATTTEAEVETPLTSVIEILTNAFEDYEKLTRYNNVAAGGRVRKAALEAINALKVVRKSVQNARNNIADNRTTTTNTTPVTNTATPPRAVWPPNAG